MERYGHIIHAANNGEDLLRVDGTGAMDPGIDAPVARTPTARSFPQVVRLNVGGCMYTTSLSTLTRYRDSMLGAMFSGAIGCASYKDGASEVFFIDRDGRAFGCILEFLRDGFLAELPRTAEERSALIREAQFYNISPLLEALRDMPDWSTGSIRAAFSEVFVAQQRYWDAAVRHFVTGLHRVLAAGAAQGICEALLDAQFFGQPGSFTLELCGDVRPRPRPVLSRQGSSKDLSPFIGASETLSPSSNISQAAIGGTPRRVVDLYEGVDHETAARLLDLVYDANSGRDAHNPLVDVLLASGVTIIRLRSTTHWAQWRLILTGDVRGQYVNPAPYALGAAAAAAEGLPMPVATHPPGAMHGYGYAHAGPWSPYGHQYGPMPPHVPAYGNSGAGAGFHALGRAAGGSGQAGGAAHARGRARPDPSVRRDVTSLGPTATAGAGRVSRHDDAVANSDGEEGSARVSLRLKAGSAAGGATQGGYLTRSSPDITNQSAAGTPALAGSRGGSVGRTVALTAGQPTAASTVASTPHDSEPASPLSIPLLGRTWSLREEWRGLPRSASPSPAPGLVVAASARPTASSSTLGPSDRTASHSRVQTRGGHGQTHDAGAEHPHRRPAASPPPPGPPVPPPPPPTPPPPGG